MKSFGSTYYEDPTVAQASALEYERLWQRIGEKVRAGVWFYQAREAVLAEEIPDISKAYGKPVADRVQRAIQQTPEGRLPPDARAAVKAGNAAACRAHLVATRGRVGWLNELSLRWFGVHLW